MKGREQPEDDGGVAGALDEAVRKHVARRTFTWDDLTPKAQATVESETRAELDDDRNEACVYTRIDRLVSEDFDLERFEAQR